MRAPSDLDELLSRTERDEATGCLLWRGPTTSIGPYQGYAVLMVNGVERPVAQVVWELTRGPIPARHFVRRTCGRRACIAPEHLYVEPKWRAMFEGRSRQLAALR